MFCFLYLEGVLLDFSSTCYSEWLSVELVLFADVLVGTLLLSSILCFSLIVFSNIVCGSLLYLSSSAFLVTMWLILFSLSCTFCFSFSCLSCSSSSFLSLTRLWSFVIVWAFIFDKFLLLCKFDEEVWLNMSLCLVTDVSLFSLLLANTLELFDTSLVRKLFKFFL